MNKNSLVKKRHIRKLITIILGPLILFLLWFLVNKLQIIDTFFLPSPQETLAKLFSLFVSQEILADVVVTLGRVSAAFFIACIVGIPTGLVLGSSKKVYTLFESTIDFFRSIPATALFPLFIIIFGIGDKSKIAVAALFILFGILTLIV